jgi:hypothetical protein
VGYEECGKEQDAGGETTSHHDYRVCPNVRTAAHA